MRFEVEILRLKSAHAKIAGKAIVDGAVHVEAEMLSTFVPRGDAGAGTE